MTFSRPPLFDEAILKLRERMPVASSMTTAEWIRSMPLAVRERSLWSATIESARFMQKLSDVLDDYLTDARELINTPDGRQVMQRKIGNKAEFVLIMRRFAEAEGLGPLDPKDAGTIKDITSSARLGMIFDVQISSAREYGRWKQGQDPDILQEFPAYRFIREQEVATPRKLHQEYEFAVRLKSDLPFWLRMNDPLIGGFGKPYGPWGFNSGMGTEEVDREEAESLGLLGPNDIVQPVDEAWNKHLEASATGLDPKNLAWIKSQLGDRVAISGDRILFVNQTKPRPAAPDAPAPAPAPAPKPAPAPPPAPAPVPAPAAPAAPPPASNRAPVADALILPTPQSADAIRHVDAMKAVLQSIAEIHDDGILPKIPFVVGSTDRGVAAWFLVSRSRLTDVVSATEIRVRPSEQRSQLTLLHEIGHWIDFGGLGTREWGAAGFGSVGNPDMKPVMDAIAASPRVAWIRGSTFSRKTKQYLLERRELWARAYAQFVASRLPKSQLSVELGLALDDPWTDQWPAEEFAPISAAIEALFRSRGWMRGQ